MAESQHIEQWRPILGYEGLYEVSCRGRVRCIKSAAGRPAGLRKCSINTHGYAKLRISTGGTRLESGVHQLVARAFIGPCPPGMQVNHKNGIKIDNRSENLEYVTPSQNVKHTYDALGRVGCKHSGGRARLTAGEVRAMRRLFDDGACNISELSRRFGVGRAPVRRIVNRLAYRHVA